MMTLDECRKIQETPLQKAEALIEIQNTLINSLVEEVRTLRAELESHSTMRG